MERRKSRPLDGAPSINSPLPALHLRGDLECITLRCSSGRLCPWHAHGVPEPLTGTAVLPLQPHRPESPSEEEPLWDRASSHLSCVLAGGGSPKGLGKVAGAAHGRRCAESLCPWERVSMATRDAFSPVFWGRGLAESWGRDLSSTQTKDRTKTSLRETISLQ